MEQRFTARGYVVIEAKSAHVVESVKKNILERAENWRDKSMMMKDYIKVSEKQRGAFSATYTFIGKSKAGFIDLIADFLHFARCEMEHDKTFSHGILKELDASKFSIHFVFTDYSVKRQYIYKAEVVIKHSAGERIEDSIVDKISIDSNIGWNEKNLADACGDATYAHIVFDSARTESMKG
jgi:hypothetical protein